MTTLSRELRNTLETTVKRARELAETAAREALHFLGVAAPDPEPHLTDAQRKLRKKLREHSRQLGDARETNGQQSIDHLAEEVAYAHWHRMLFARFLAENELLIHPEHGVAVTLAQCQELAEYEGRANGWTLACEYASGMLPQIFRPGDSALALQLSPNRQQELEALLAGLDAATFKTSDALGWVYQFWQTKKKDEVNGSEKKIGADELAAVTQLFTEDYMVDFLLQNSLGAWWVGNVPDKPLPNEMPYLRFVEEPTAEQDGKTVSRPAAGCFEGWPKTLEEFKLLDPCCGSGHFLVAAFLMLVPMRMTLEELTAQEAVDAVLRENLYGLELDARCVEIAVFALALGAWTYPDAGGYRTLPAINVACSGLGIAQKEAEWLELANGDGRLRAGMKGLYDAFRQAPTLGSLIDPRHGARGDLFTADYAELAPLLDAVLRKEVGKEDDAGAEAALTAQGLAQAAAILAQRYSLVVTNPPYLVRGKQCELLQEFCATHYGHAKNDLANVFLERCLELCAPGGVMQMVMPQNWLFLKSYQKQREHLLKHATWNLLARLGMAAFEIMDWWAFNVILLTLTQVPPVTDSLVHGLDASQPRTPEEKAALLRLGGIVTLSQKGQLEKPDAVFSLVGSGRASTLGDYAGCFQGVSTGDNARFVIQFWEIPHPSEDWLFFQYPTRVTVNFGGRDSYVRQSLLAGDCESGAIRGREAWQRRGVAIARVGSLSATLYSGDYFANTAPVIIPKNEQHLPAIWAFAKSPKFYEVTRELNQALNVDNGYLAKVPFELSEWEVIASAEFPNGLPAPYSDDPTQWVFHGHPKPATNPLHVAVAWLLGYRWPAESDKQMELSDQARSWIKLTCEIDEFADEDGIVCLPAVRGEAPADARLLELLMAAWGDDWSPAVLDRMLKDADCEGEDLAYWLQEKFFSQHCRFFHHRPFIWHIWDGLKDGFAALVNYHKLDYAGLEALTYTYLGDWIRLQEAQAKAKVDGADIRLAAAKGLQAKLKLILEGEAPYDIFVRWKLMGQQPVGWYPDLNDGVRLNIRPFVTVGDVGRKGAGVLRDRPNIDWRKDRGKDVASAPWYSEFRGERINDHHLTLWEKTEARARLDKKKVTA